MMQVGKVIGRDEMEINMEETIDKEVIKIEETTVKAVEAEGVEILDAAIAEEDILVVTEKDREDITVKIKEIGEIEEIEEDIVEVTIIEMTIVEIINTTDNKANGPMVTGNNITQAQISPTQILRFYANVTQIIQSSGFIYQVFP